MLATLVKLAQRESSRNALILAGVLDMVVQWLDVTLTELNSVTADKQQPRAPMERQTRGDQQPAVVSAVQLISAGHGWTYCDVSDNKTSVAEGAETIMPDASLQLLRLTRNLCAAGSAVAMHMTAHEVPATLAGIILQLHPHVAGERT